jgi:hypothetical protein
VSKKGVSQVERPRDLRSWAILVQNFGGEKVKWRNQNTERAPKEPEEKRTQAARNAPSASLRSENNEMKARWKWRPLESM